MTDPLFKLNPLLPYWLLAIVFAMTVSFFIWLELRKANRYKSLRILCVSILALAVLAIALQPKVRKLKSDFKILITGKSESNITDSLEKKFPGAEVLFFKTEKSSDAKKSISSPNEIPSDEIKIIVGNGLTRSALDLFDKESFTFIPSQAPKGIIDLSLPKKPKVQLRSKIAGIYNSNGDSAKIILEGPGGKEDSVIISKKGISSFNLSFTPKQNGNFVYAVSINGNKEFIPINVESEIQMKILVLQMFPTFESGYLKNILSENHKLVLRYQLSKNNFRYEYVNHPSIRADRLTNEILNSFDLVIIDTDALARLSQAERNNLDIGISSGLGTLVLFNETPKSNRNLKSILPITFRPIDKDTAQFALMRKLNLPAWSVEPVNDGKIIPTIKNKNRVLAGYVYKGFGKIGFQLLQETYKLTLEGDSSSYKNLWTTVLQKNARTASENFQITIENDFPIYPNEPVTIQIIGSSQSPPILIHNGNEIAMVEDVLIDDLWKTKVWPDKSGWQELQVKGDSAKKTYYVSENGAWKSLAEANSIRNAKAMASSKPIDPVSSWEYKPFAPWLFYFLILISAAVLWLVPKI